MVKKVWITALVLVMAVGLMPVAAFAQSPNYYTSIIVSDVTSGAPVVGGAFTTDISLSITNNTTPPVGIMGVDLWLQFSDANVAVDDANDNPADGIQVFVSTGFFGSSVVIAKNEVVDCLSGGKCVHLALATTGAPVTNRTGKIATVTWAGVAAGPMGLLVMPETIVADSEGDEVPVNSTTVPAINIMEPGFINGRVERQGTKTDHANTDVIAYNSGGGVVANALTAADGTFQIVVPAGGTYLVQAMYNGYLKAQKGSVYVVGGTVNLGTTQLRGGDVNSDNNINILDIVTIISKFSTAGWATTEPADINDDGTVNILDLTIAAGNYGRVGPTAW